MLEVYCWLLLVGGWATFPQFPLFWFNDLAGVAHSQAMWPQPWHWKHWSEPGSFLLEALPCPFLGPWTLPWPWPMVDVPWPVDMLQAKVVCPRPVWPLRELGQLEVALSVLQQPLCVGLLGCTAWAVTQPCSCQGSHQPGHLISQLRGSLNRLSASQLTLPTPCLGPLHFQSLPCRQQP